MLSAAHIERGLILLGVEASDSAYEIVVAYVHGGDVPGFGYLAPRSYAALDDAALRDEWAREVRMIRAGIKTPQSISTTFIEIEAALRGWFLWGWSNDRGSLKPRSRPAATSQTSARSI